MSIKRISPAWPIRLYSVTYFFPSTQLFRYICIFPADSFQENAASVCTDIALFGASPLDTRAPADTASLIDASGDIDVLGGPVLDFSCATDGCDPGLARPLPVPPGTFTTTHLHTCACARFTQLEHTRATRTDDFLAMGTAGLQGICSLLCCSSYVRLLYFCRFGSGAGEGDQAALLKPRST